MNVKQNKKQKKCEWSSSKIKSKKKKNVNEIQAK